MKFVNRKYFSLKNRFSTRLPRIFKIVDKRKIAIKFFFAGSSAAAVNLLFLIIFHGWFRWGLIFSTSLAFIISFLVSFTLQKFWTFRNYHYKRMPVQLVLYLINAVIGLNLNAFLMHLLVNRFQLWYVLAQIGVTILIGGYNYLAYHFIVFRQR